MGGTDIEARTPAAHAPSDLPPASPGLEIARGAVDPRLIDDALRLLHLDLLERGAGADELGTWLWATHWFPHLTYAPQITGLADALPDRWQTGERCDPQILLQFPHSGPEPAVTFHRDEEPPWAGERRYRRIVGIALSPWRADNGGLLARVDDCTVAVELDPGDAVMMGPEVWHSGGINRTGSIRYGVYFRWLGDAPPAAITTSG